MSGLFGSSSKPSILTWVVLLVVGILITMLVMHIVRLVEQWISTSRSREAASMLDSPVTCILIDIVIWLFFGMFLNECRAPVWAIALYIIIYEVVTQCFLSYAFPQFYNATLVKSIFDVGLSILAYWIGILLQRRATNKGRNQCCKQRCCKPKNCGCCARKNKCDHEVVA
jgi:hypothetical protein